MIDTPREPFRQPPLTEEAAHLRDLEELARAEAQLREKADDTGSIFRRPEGIPVGPNNLRSPGEPGLTKREFFAAFAMQSLNWQGDLRVPGYVARRAVEIADALIDELAGKGLAGEEGI